ncbi:putative RNA-directed DNA polymerase [Tanacetum coccineum]
MAGDDDQIKTKDGEGSRGGITYDSPYYLHPSDYPKQLHVNEGWLTTAMEKNIRNNVKYAGTALEIWSDLNERFGKESAPMAYELKQKIASTRQGGTSVSIYFTQLRSIWDEAQSIYPFPRCSCNKCVCDVGKKINEHQEKERLYEFLMGWMPNSQSLEPKSWQQNRFLRSEQRITWRNDPPGSNKERSGTKAVKEGIEHYTECNKDGHKREGCFKLIGYPEWWPEKKGEKTKGKAACVETETSPIPGLTNEDYQYFLKHFSGTGNSKGTRPVANMAHKEDEEGEWIFDSGCTEYITYLSNILVNRKATHFEAPVIIPNGDSIPVKRKGDYVLQGGTKVNGVLYVPDFKCNLLSVSRLCHDLQCSISFFLDFWDYRRGT